MKPGIYQGLSMPEYLALPAVSAGILHTLDIECPRAAWHRSWLNPGRVRDDGSKVMDIGTVAHAILLEGTEACVASIDAPDWRTKAAKEERDAARAAGKIPLLAHQLPAIRGMVGAACEFIESLKTTEPAIHAMFQGDGESEVTLVWEDAVDGLRCRARPDRISKDRKVIVDYKTVSRSAEPNGFGRMIGNMGYDISVAFYRRGVLALAKTLPTYVFLVQEVEAPHLCSLVSLEPPYIEFAQRRVVHSLERWSACARTNEWPGYPGSRGIRGTAAMGSARHEERMVVSGIPYDVEKVWEKPEAIEARAAARRPVEFPPEWLGPQA
jgi:hypothetical protein